MDAVGAAQQALAAGDVGAAVAALRQAVATSAAPAARHLLGGLLFFDDDFAGARREWEAAFREWRDRGDARAAALVAADLADVHCSGLGNAVVGHGWILRARALLESVGKCVELGYVQLALIACETEPVQLERSARSALRLAGEFADPELEVLARANLGYALVVQGRVRDGFTELDQAMAALSSGELRNPAVIGKSYCALLSACDRTGDAARAAEWIRVVEQTFTGPLGGRPRASRSHCRLALGSALCAAGRVSDGEAALLAVLGPEGSVYAAHRAEAAARLATLRAVQGRAEEAAVMVAPYADRPAAGEVLARVHLMSGEPELADAVARRGLGTVGGDALRAATLRGLLVEIALARDDVAVAAEHAGELGALADRADSSLIHSEAALARGRVAAARLDATAAIQAFESARILLHVDHHPLRAGVVALALAQAFVALGDRGAALDAARTAVAIFDRLGAAPLLDESHSLLRSLGARTGAPRRRPTDAVGRLTGRERQVLELLPLGLTNAEIGRRLFITEKTVEHHVTRTLAKLGVRSRAEAVAVAVAAAGSAEL